MKLVDNHQSSSVNGPPKLSLHADKCMHMFMHACICMEVIIWVFFCFKLFCHFLCQTS